MGAALLLTEQSHAATIRFPARGSDRRLPEQHCHGMASRVKRPALPARPKTSRALCLQSAEVAYLNYAAAIE